MNPLAETNVTSSVSSYLQQFIVEQHYEEYTPQDHAVWRYIMRRNVSFLKGHAHEAYLDGLKKTGITLERIPNIEEMNHALAKIGWKAVVVDGFVPPAAFMEFQALKILVISAEIRNINNVLYTPAPDIIHEAAGHAPIIADPEYSLFLQKFGEYGMRAIFSKEDYEIYEAIRYLSIIKEFPETPAIEIIEAEADLDRKMKAISKPSESNLLSRMHWWTVEYGLVGTPDHFKLFGAGLLSSVGESKHCLSDEVQKIPLSVECCNYAYDITTMQPQLFVAKDFSDLHQTLETFANSMAFRSGGKKALQLLKDTEQVGTIELNTGIQVSGTISEFLVNDHNEPIFVQIDDQWSFAVMDKEIHGFGISDHPNGFYSPIGTLKSIHKSLDELTPNEIKSLQIETGNSINLEYESGIVVRGLVKSVHFSKSGNIQFLQIQDCTISHKQEVFKTVSQTLGFIVAGKSIVSGFSGSADKEKFPVYPPKSQRKAIKVQHSSDQLVLFKLYTMVREMRESKILHWDTIDIIHEKLSLHFKYEWLLRIELLEILQNHHVEDSLTVKLVGELNELKKVSKEYHNLISAGLQLIYEPAIA